MSIGNDSEVPDFNRLPQPRLSLFQRSPRGLGKPSKQLKQLMGKQDNQTSCGDNWRWESDGQRFQPQGKFFKGWQSNVIEIFKANLWDFLLCN